MSMRVCYPVCFEEDVLPPPHGQDVLPPPHAHGLGVHAIHRQCVLLLLYGDVPPPHGPDALAPFCNAVD